jgi:hypothetical protein
MRGAARRGRAVVAAVSVSWGCAGSAFAQIPQDGGAGDANPAPESTRAPDAARTVDVTVVAGGDDTDALMGTIRELLGRLGLRIEPHVLAAGSPAVAPGEPSPGLSVWIDFASRYEAVTIVRRGRTEVRRTIPRDSSPAIVREEIGEAVRSGVEAQLLVDATASAPPPPVAALPPPAPVVREAPAPAAGSTRWFALDLTILAGGGYISSDSGVVPRVEGGVVLGSRRRLRPSLTVTAAYSVPFNGDPLANVNGDPHSNVTAHASVVSVRAVPAIELAHASWLAVNVGVGGGVDIISVSGRSTDSTIQGSSNVPDRVDPILTAQASLYLAFAPSVAFTVVAGADVDFVPPVYDIGSPLDQDVLRPWRVRPVALAGFTFTAIGRELFVARTP